MNYKQAFDGLVQAQTNLTVLQAVLNKLAGQALMNDPKAALGGKSANQILTTTAKFIESLHNDMEKWPRESGESKSS